MAESTERNGSARLMAFLLHPLCGETLFLDETIPSQADQGVFGWSEGVETRGLSPNNNGPRECPASHVDDEIVRTVWRQAEADPNDLR